MVHMIKHEKGNKALSGKRLWFIRGVIFLFTILFLILTLLAFELFARWYYRDILSTSHGRDYFYYKSHHLFKAERNNIRFRGRDIHVRIDDTFRVIVLGDSLTWGQGILPFTSRFPELAETLFEKRYPGTDIEVINLGIPGYNLRDHLHMLPFVMQLKPDFVLYQWYVNDMEEKVDIPEFHALTLIPNPKWHEKLMKHSVTYILLYRTWNQLRTAIGLQKSYTEYLVNKLGDPKNKASVWADKTLHKLITSLENSGIDVGIILFPQCRSKMSEYELAFLHERVLSECRHDQITCLDLRNAYSAFDNDMKALRASFLDGHPSKTAHRIAAEKIVDVFGPEWQKELTGKNGKM